MRKKIINITFFLLMVVLNFFPVSIWAKEISKTCKYDNTEDDGTIALVGYSYLEIYIYSDKTVYSKIFNFNGKDIWDNKEPVLNLEKADECPHYAVIGWIDKLGPINEYEVHASDDVESLRAKSFDKTSIVDWIEYGSGSNRNEALQYAKEETTKMETYMQTFSSDNCKDEKWGDGNNYGCRKDLESHKNDAYAASNKIYEYIKHKDLSESDTEYQNFKSTYERLKTFCEQQDKKLKKQSDEDIKNFISGGNNSDQIDDTTYKNFYDEKDKSYYKCGNLTRIPKGVPKFTNLLYKLVKVIVPIILVVMGTSDFLRAVSANDEKSMDETPKRFARRIGAAVLIYFVMTMVQLVIKVIDTDNKSSVLSCAKCFISSEKKCETYNYSFGQAAGGETEGGGFK